MSFANTLNYPEIIDTEQKLNIFFDYVIHSWLDFYHHEYCKFRGVRTENDYYRRKVIVNVPLYTVPEKQMGLSKLLKYDVDQVLMRLSASLALGCDVEVHLLINCRDDTISSTSKLEREREVNKMFIPEVEKIIHRTSKRGEFFTVVWKDSTTTTVKLMEGDESDDYTAFLYAVGKKMFENKGVARNYIAEKKAVFENEMEQKSVQKARVRRQQAIQQSLDAEDFPDVADLVYGEMFVAPALISKTMFRKNKR